MICGKKWTNVDWLQILINMDSICINYVLVNDYKL